MRSYFRAAGAPDLPAADPAAAARWLADAPARLAQPLRPDSPEEIRDRLARAA
jgi:hypothetical protein